MKTLVDTLDAIVLEAEENTARLRAIVLDLRASFAFPQDLAGCVWKTHECYTRLMAVGLEIERNTNGSDFS